MFPSRAAILAPPSGALGLALEPLRSRYRLRQGGRLTDAALGRIVAFSRNSIANDVTPAGQMIEFPRDTLRDAGGGWLLEGSTLNTLVGSAELATQSVSIIGAGTRTLSFQGTGTVELSGAGTGTLTGTGASDRVQIVVPVTAGTLLLTVTDPVALAQLEAGSLATSYFGTTTAPATRSADLLGVVGDRFAAIFGDGRQGWVIVDMLMATQVNLSVGRMLVSLHDATNQNRMALRLNSAGGSLVGVPTVEGIAQSATFAPGSVPYGTTFRAGIRWSGSAYSVCFGGGALASNTNAPAGGYASMYLGSDASGAASAFGRLQGTWAGRGFPDDDRFRAACVVGASVDTLLGF